MISNSFEYTQKDSITSPTLTRNALGKKESDFLSLRNYELCILALDHSRNQNYFLNLELFNFVYFSTFSTLLLS